MAQGIESPRQDHALPLRPGAREGGRHTTARPSHSLIEDSGRFAVFSLHWARLQQRANLTADLSAGHTMPLREMLRSIFGRGWARLAAATLNRSEAQIYGSCRRDAPLSTRDLACLLAIIATCRVEIEKEWREARVAARRLVFDWARDRQLRHLDAERRRRLDELSAAEAWIRDATPNPRNREKSRGLSE
jgi:hypothetical protein